MHTAPVRFDSRSPSVQQAAEAEATPAAEAVEFEVCDAPRDPAVPSRWYDLVVPAGVCAVRIDAVGGGAVGEAGRRVFGARVLATVPAAPGERITVRTSASELADGGSEVLFASNWAERWILAAGGRRPGSSWAPVGAHVEERAHDGPGRVTLVWVHDVK